ncbi:hypothetical protein [Litchfieldia alkalitelluris]|uniref:hypothetical protein n=1 Tax=Litchfieldia alkalitelluris TaxID=304268 RepID=UPI00195C2A14|nr:hypothetical protein [Litchfieldia alkalitelluris]
MIIVNKKSWFYVIIAFIVGSAISFLSEFGLHMIFLSLFYACLMYRGVMYAEYPWSKLLPIRILWTLGFSVYFISYFVYQYFNKLTPFLTTISWGAIIFVLITLFISNTEHLRQATLSKQEKPYIGRTLKAQNKVFIILTFITVILIVNFKIVQDSIFHMVRSFLMGIIWFISLFPSEQGTEDREQPPEKQPFAPISETSEPSLLSQILNWMFIVGGVIIVSITIIVLFYFILKKGKQWLQVCFKGIMTFLNRVLKTNQDYEEQNQYIDEKESLIDWNRINKKLSKGIIQNVLNQMKKKKLTTNKEKVRDIYLSFVLYQTKKGYFYKSSNTPKETLNDLKKSNKGKERELLILEDVYNRARYSEKHITNDEIKEVSSLADK